MVVQQICTIMPYTIYQTKFGETNIWQFAKIYQLSNFKLAKLTFSDTACADKAGREVLHMKLHIQDCWSCTILALKYQYISRVAAMMPNFLGPAYSSHCPGSHKLISSLCFARALHSIPPAIAMDFWAVLILSVTNLMVKLPRSYFGLHFSFDTLNTSHVSTLKFQICLKSVGKI